MDGILDAIVNCVPAPKSNETDPLRALIFDSKYDPYKGVVAYVRVFDGAVPSGSRIKVMSTGTESDVLEVGAFRPNPTSVDRLGTGEVGYIATGLKSVGDAPVGDTITLAGQGADTPLKGYQPLKPMVFAGLYPADGEEYLDLRDALEKLRLNDAALTFQPENSLAARLRFSLRFPGVAAHGHRAGEAGARVRPEPAGYLSQRRLPCGHDGWNRSGYRKSGQTAFPAGHFRDKGTLARPERNSTRQLHWGRHGTGQEPSG